MRPTPVHPGAHVLAWAAECRGRTMILLVPSDKTVELPKAHRASGERTDSAFPHPFRAVPPPETRTQVIAVGAIRRRPDSLAWGPRRKAGQLTSPGQAPWPAQVSAVAPAHWIRAAAYRGF